MGGDLILACGLGLVRRNSSSSSSKAIHALIQVIAGKDKGTIGTITRVLTTTGKCVVEGVNIKTKHIAPRTENETGSIKKSEYPIHHSNVMLYSKEKGVRSRVGHKMAEDGTKVKRPLEGFAC